MSDTNAYQLLAWRKALQLEIKTGMKFSRGSIMNMVKRRFPDFKGRTKQAIHDQLDAYIKANILPEEEDR
ncbi:MAG: hypothetical protein GY759_09080 [Chloroflexi bacterium]|nr:hypothetical protein [Chloroflexota bacterium]